MRFGDFFETQSEMKPQSTRAWILWLILPAAFAGIWQLQKRIDIQRATLHGEQDELMLRSGKLVKALSLEYAPLVADIYWTRVVQYYGNKHVNNDTNLQSLWPLLDITTTLDPHLLPAYRFGGMFLSEAPPAGAGRPDLAVKLLERGVRENPDYWRFYEDLGFVYYFDFKDYKKAAAVFYEGSKKPDAQIWMKVMAAKIMAQGESLDTSIFLWREVYETAKDPRVKQNAGEHLELLKVEADCRQIDALSAEFEKREGRPPRRIAELIQAGLLRGMPVDALGYAYVLGENGKAELSLDSPLLEKQLMMKNLQ
jgi:tetratricopeptide (TPR) repeat protein